MEIQNEKLVKTGTTTIGVVCKDGIVLAADMRATAGHMIANINTEKVFPIAENLAITIAGLVSDAQLISKYIKAEVKLKTIRSNRFVTVKEAANLLAGMSYENVRRPSMVPGIVGFLMAGHDSTGHHLYEIGVDGSIFEHDTFCSDGSGSVFVLGYLETAYNKNITVAEGVKMVETAFTKASFRRDSASGNGYNILVIDQNGVEKVIEKKFD